LVEPGFEGINFNFFQSNSTLPARKIEKLSGGRMKDELHEAMNCLHVSLTRTCDAPGFGFIHWRRGKIKKGKAILQR
jgi:hypothetical protein